MTTIDFTYFATVIRAEMGQLKVLSKAAKESRAPVGLDQQSGGRLSRMDAIQKQSVELATEDRRQQRLMALAAALLRIKAGNYGYCLKCDDEISAGRLAADPTASLCIGYA